MVKKDNLYILVLQILNKHLVNGITFSEMGWELKKNGFDIFNDKGLTSRVRRFVDNICENVHCELSIQKLKDITGSADSIIEFLEKKGLIKKYSASKIRFQYIGEIKDCLEDCFANEYEKVFLAFKEAMDVGNLYLLPEGYFQLLQWEELNEARESSRKAKKDALCALVISSVLALSSILIQLFSPVSLDENQFQVIKQIENKLIR